jgi:hypothetical protein
MKIMFSPLSSECFSSNFQQARQRILRASNALDIQSLTFLHPLNGPEHTELACDWFWLSPNHASKLLVIISATHGVEGITGSALQLDLLRSLQQLLQQHNQLQILLIHALNPWGFAWLRRGDEQNIDLNRNFIDFDHSLPENCAYDAIHCALMSDNNTELSRFRQQTDQTYYEKAVSGGQYQHRDGIYFGGICPSWSRQILEMQLADGLPDFKRIAVIDLHTGLGPYGYGEIISDHKPGSAGDRHASRWYGKHVTSPLMGTSISVTKVGLLDYFWHELIGDRGCFITLEFGTYGTAALFECLIQEQRLYNQVGRQSDSVLFNTEVQQLLEHFNPVDNYWREMVLWRARQVVTMAVCGLLE